MQASDGIAVVGVAYKLPQDVEDDGAFWEILQGARNLSSEWPPERMNAEAHPDVRNGKVSPRAGNCMGIEQAWLTTFRAGAQLHSSSGHFIRQDPAGFDAPLFGLTAKEAASMDPVQRWTLEVSYRAFENAGIPFETLKGSRTAVVSATFTEDYIRMAAMDPDNVERMAATGCLASVIPNRVSYFFGMQGPSFHVDTACSSGLSAFDTACKLLKCGDAGAALVTAANLILEPGMYQMFRNLQMLSPDGTCKAFDHRANGFGRGEGVLAFVLKPVATALRDGDTIRAVVRAVASNQDGHTPALSQPNPVAQEDLIRSVYARASLDRAKTRYVEAHGTGTAVGDPIEMKAIGNAFRESRSNENPLYVGSVKTNVGHLEGASGLVGILKAILILENGIIPPNALFEKLNPAIDAELLRVEVPSQSIPWPSKGLRRVSVNGFGFGGSNTHVVLDDALHFLEEHGLVGNHSTAVTPVAVTTTNGLPLNGTAHLDAQATNGGSTSNGATSNRNVHTDGSSGDGKSACSSNNSQHPKLVVFSAFDEKATKRTVEGYSSWYKRKRLSSQPHKLDALAYTLAVRRSHMRWRSFAIARPSKTQPGESDLITLSPFKPVRVASEPSLGWVFTGQGAQYVDMGWELVGMYPVFEETLRTVDGVYRDLGCQWSIFGFTTATDELRQNENINKPEYSQPLSTAIQLALVELLRSFQITPKAVVGHSSGEIAAAYSIGALSLVSACKVSYFRGLVAGKIRNASATSGGSMISINLAPDQVADFLSKLQPETIGVAIACINSPLNVTLSGPQVGIDAVRVHADEQGIFARELKTGVAYHSLAMQHVAEEYSTLMGSLEFAEVLPIPMVSTVTGKVVHPAELATNQYWIENMVSPVRFATAVQLIASDSDVLGITDFVEVGPHPALRRYVQDTLGNDKMQYSSALYRGRPATDTILELAGFLFCRGHKSSLVAVNGQQEQGTTTCLVDCPPYPFDHSRKFWAESRISRDYRLRTATKGDLLGHRASDWNPLLPRWRNFLSVETHPWIGHHVVGDTVLYPAAGMLIMAMEAAQEMAPLNQEISGYLFEEARFISPVVVPEHWDDRVETMLSLRPVNNRSQGDDSSPAWFAISIFAYKKETHSWTEVFNTNLQIQYESSNNQAEKAVADDVARAQHDQAMETCTLPVDSHLLYSDAADNGLQYGEWFQLCRDIRWDRAGARAIASVPVSNARLDTASLVHPTVLDTAFHVLRASAGQQHAANVPVRLANAWFSWSGWQAPATKNLRWLASSRGTGKTRRGEKGSVSALADDGTILATIGTLETAAVSTNESDSLVEGGEAASKKLLYGIEWKPQLSLLAPDQLSKACEADTFPRDAATMLAEHRKRTAVLNIVAVRHVRNIPEEDRSRLDSTLRHHMDWMEHHVRSLPPNEREAAEALTDAEFEAELDAFAASFPSWTLYPHVARSLPAIVAGEMDPLQVIFESDHAKTFYASLFHTVCGDGRLNRFLDLAAHETPALRILEVGAGTGGMTVHILNALSAREKRTGAVAFAEYTYTDISPVFFESAKARWDKEGFGGRMSFKALDMEHSVASQGFSETSYDLVVAGSCIHATGLLSQTLQNLHRLLKPGGRLVMLEVTDPTDIATCFFATLASGWWLSREEWRVKNKSPLASEDAWHRVLKENGFSGNDLVLRDTEEQEAHIVSVIVSTAVEVEEGTPAPASRRVFVVDTRQTTQKELADALSSGRDVTLSLDDISSALIGSDDIVVSLAEVDQPLLADIPETHFVQLQALFSQAANLIWVTAPSNGTEQAQLPHYSIAQGLLRTLRAEMPNSRIVSLAFEDFSSIETRVGFVTSTINIAFGSSPSPELEYSIRSGQIHTARAVEDVSANAEIHSLLTPSLQQMAWKDGPALKLGVGEDGNLDSLRFELDEAHATNLGPRDVEIEAKAWGVTRRDVLSALGRLDEEGPDNLGTDCAGIVTRIGPDCDAEALRPGDRVIMLARGCMSKFPRAHETRVLKIPAQLQEMAFESVIAALGPALTAYHALDVARLEQGDRVLVHDATSATGQMAVQIAKMQGADVLATTTTSGDDEEEINFLSTMGVARDDIFSASNYTTSFASGIRRITQGHGVDAVVNKLGGEQARASWELLAPSGRFVEIGPGDNDAFPRSATAGSLRRNTTFATVDILDLRPQTTGRLLKSVMNLVEEGKITPPSPVRVFPATQLKEAFGVFQKGEATGRVVIVPGADDVVPQFVKRNGQDQFRFDENASYLVPGGLGGVGRSILAWMAAHGAKHLIVPSRSGPSSTAAAKLLASLSSQGVDILTPKCNIANNDELAALLESSKQTMPAIRGVINCAMVLTNAVFTNMAFNQWSSAVQAKVDTSFNLHRLLAHHGLDFFVHLASLAGVNGQMASANYAAGCTFQDACASMYPGVTVLDVGWMADVGLIAETAAYQRQLKDWGNMQRVEERELLGVLEMVCDAKGVKEVEEDGVKRQQLLVGLLTPADYLSKGKVPPSGLSERPLLSTFSQPISRNDKSNKASSADATTPAVDYPSLFRAATDDKSRAVIVASALAHKLARAMMVSADDVDTNKPLSAYGIDSLMAVELRNWIGREFGAKLGMWELMTGERAVKGIAEAVVRKSGMTER
ncbi:Lovastatin diketide synthase LovF [Neonectria ditissima]|uniref:Lovastatin diketide synthase LovF n=1 Tax=Neonectria ditissima TaxID=78410 RepID=A0A0N8H7Z8_9HYPO|nr:Lovastatin diketide synthase LovF [Neonectria ditissima]